MKSGGGGRDDREVSTLCHITGGVTWRKPSIIDLTYIYILCKDSERAFPGERDNIILYLLSATEIDYYT